MTIKILYCIGELVKGKSLRMFYGNSEATIRRVLCVGDKGNHQVPPDSPPQLTTPSPTTICGAHSKWLKSPSYTVIEFKVRFVRLENSTR